MAMPIRFDKEKKYVVIASPSRTSYYESQKRRFSLDMLILNLEELQNLFSKPIDKKEFADREIIISGYYHSGDLIAHYLNSLSSHMAIGYEIEDNKNDVSVTKFSSPKDEYNYVSLLLEKNKNKRDVYLINLGDTSISFSSSVRTINDIVSPLDSSLYIVGLGERKYSNQEKEDIQRLLKSSRIVFISSSNSNLESIFPEIKFN